MDGSGSLLGTDDRTPLEERLRSEIRPEVEAEVRAELEPALVGERSLERDRALRALTVAGVFYGSVALIVLAGVAGLAVRLFMFAAFR